MIDRIVDLKELSSEQREIIAHLLMRAFAKNYPDAWKTFESALEEVNASLEEGRISRVALTTEGKPIGWIGGISQYDGNVWELHPLAVDVDCQRQGVGIALVQDFENQVKLRGGYTILLGTDDESNSTSVSGKNLYPDPIQHLQDIQNYADHPFIFYQKLGYAVVGIIPDANGPGKPDILMAKNVNFS